MDVNASELTSFGHGVPAVVEDYRYSLHEASKPERSLILLGPWNGSTGFFDEWLLSEFDKDEPSTKTRYRVLDVVARKMATDDANPYSYNSWYEYEDWHAEIPVASDVDLAVAYVHKLLVQEHAIVGDYRHIILAGFSQGANVAIEAALRFPHRLGLVFSQRGIILASRKQDWTPVAASPYILTAGADDDVYYEEMVKENCRWLEAMHAPAYMKTLPTVDHYRWSSRECQLTIKSFAAMVSESPDDALAQLTEWTDCHAAAEHGGDSA